MGSSGGRELRSQLCDGSREGNLLEEGCFLKFFEETPAKCVDQEEHHGIIVVGGQSLCYPLREDVNPPVS